MFGGVGTAGLCTAQHAEGASLSPGHQTDSFKGLGRYVASRDKSTKHLNKMSAKKTCGITESLAPGLEATDLVLV